MIKITLSQLALALITGILPLTVLPVLPDLRLGIVLLLIAAIAGYLPYRLSKLLCIALAAFLWATVNAQQILQQTDDFSGRKQQVVAEVITPFLQREDKHNLLIALKEINGQRVFPPLAARISSEDLPADYCAGQRWLLTLSLRPVHSQLNLGGFDGQRWAVANRQTLNGHVDAATPLTTACSARQRVISAVQRQLTGVDNMPILLALAFGERSLLDSPLAQLFKMTGTAHLMAISGLHIGVAALIGWLLARAIQYLLPIRWIDYRFPLLLSGITMLYYTWLSGVNPPAMRAAVAISLWLLLRLLRVRCHPWQVWLWGVALLMCSDPLNILSAVVFCCGSADFLVSMGAIGGAVFTALVLGVAALGASATGDDLPAATDADCPVSRFESCLFLCQPVGGADCLAGHRAAGAGGAVFKSLAL